MKYAPEIHHRHSIRLRGNDYAMAGAYFVTICVQNRECLFGDIVDGQMVLNEAGRMIEKWYHELPNKFPHVNCDQYIVMPNHFHAIIQITGTPVGADPRVCPRGDDPEGGINTQPQGEHAGSPLPTIVLWFKTMTTNAYIHGVKQNHWRPFPGKLWQRNYFERIIRNEIELNRVREYIVNNPVRWPDDKENDENGK